MSAESQHRAFVSALADAVMDGQAWGSVQLPDGYGGTRGATLEEAEEALCRVIGRLREHGRVLAEYTAAPSRVRRASSLQAILDARDVFA